MGYMQSWLFEAAECDDISVLKKDVIAKNGEENYLLTTPDVGNNIVHIAARYGSSKFIDEALKCFPNLLQQKNNKGNTPLHHAAEIGNEYIVDVLLNHLNNITDSFEKNNDGNTPFHVALRSRNLAAAEILFSQVVKANPHILLIKNNFGETPLHLHVRYCTGGIFPEKLDLHDDKLVHKMIDANPLAIFEHDLNGFNPLMIASQYGCVLIVLRILRDHRQSIECQDRKGRSFLHHLGLSTSHNARDKDSTLWICQKILELRGVDILLFSRDEDGNTPLHLAILCREFDLALLFLQRYTAMDPNHTLSGYASATKEELIVSIKNNEGKSVFDLITSISHVPINLKILTEHIIKCRAKIMDTELYKAACKGDKDIFGSGNGDAYYFLHLVGCKGDKNIFGSGKDDAYFLSQAPDGSNILHLAAQRCDDSGRCLSFLLEGIKRFPDLIHQKNSNGDTPLHVIARFQIDSPYHITHISTVVDKLLKLWQMVFKRLQDGWTGLRVPEWKVKNSAGRTFFDELIYANNPLVLLYSSINQHGKFEINEYGENCLHMAARYLGREFKNVLVVETLDFKGGGYICDRDGLTPVSRAAYCGKIWLVIMMGKVHPEALTIADNKGRIMLHHLCSSPVLLSEAHVNELQGLFKLLKDHSMINLLLARDHDGNTPLHLAIMHQNFEVATYFIKHYSKKQKPIIRKLVGLKNKVGNSITNLISCASDIPQILKKLIKPASLAETMDDHLYQEASLAEIDACVITPKYLTQTLDGSNVIHIAVRHLNFSFLDKIILGGLYLFLYDCDSQGETPLHLAVQHNPPPQPLLQFLKMCSDMDSTYMDSPPLWTVKNSKGNTFIHEAARLSNYQFISFIFQLYGDSTAAEIREVTSDSDETILHVIARYANYTAKDFLEKEIIDMKTLAHMSDQEGFTPILRAVQCGRLGVAKFLVRQYPRSVEVSDNKGRTVLHLLKAFVVDLVDDLKDILPVWNDLFKHPEVDNLRTAQNEDGNTPLHLAIIEADFTKAKYLIERCLQSQNKQELDLVNNDGHTIFDLLSSRAHIPNMKQLQSLVSRSYVKEREYINLIMDDELYKAAIEGNVEIFKTDVESGSQTLEEGYFCRQTPSGSNIVHIALRHGNSNTKEFVETALRHFPILSIRSDNNGDTPLHLAAKWKGGVPIELLVQKSELFLGRLDENKKAFHVAPWAVKNNKGNFPIHEALMTDNLIDARSLLNCDTEAAFRVNDMGETPLHAFARNGGFSVNDAEADKFVKELIDKRKEAVYTRDDEGLTPLLSAARSGHFQIVRAILNCQPQSAYLRDPNSKTFLHLLRFTGEDANDSFAGTFKKTGKQLFEIPEADTQRLAQDNEGNTPLHYAIKSGNSIAAIVLAQRCLDSQNQAELGLADKDGQTIPDLLATHDVPCEIIELIRKKVPKAVYLARSSYGIRKAEMKESASALSVVAALLATTTFAAAFQVPGGFNSEDGSPVLLTKPAFKVFVMANSTAMCSSMLCLFFLLWVMGIGKIHGSLMLLDFSIILLRLSFYLTLLAFTMGVFVVTAKNSLGLAIAVCGLCLLTFLLTWRFSIQLVVERAVKVSEKTKEYVKSSVGEGGQQNAALTGKLAKFKQFFKSVICTGGHGNQVPDPRSGTDLNPMASNPEPVPSVSVPVPDFSRTDDQDT